MEALVAIRALVEVVEKGVGLGLAHLVVIGPIDVLVVDMLAVDVLENLVEWLT